MSAITSETILAALADGPRDEEELVVELAQAAGLGDDDRAAWTAFAEALDVNQVIDLADGRLASRDWALGGLTAWHRLDEVEVARREVDVGLDGLFHLDVMGGDEVVLVGDHVVTLQHDPTPMPVILESPIIPLPDGWEPDLAAGHLVGLTLDGDLVRLVRADPDHPGPGPDDAADLRSTLEDLGREEGTLLAAASTVGPDAWVLDLEGVVPQLLAHQRDLVRSLGQPLDDLLGATGLAHRGTLVAGPVVAEHQLAVYAVGRQITASALWDDDDPVEEVGMLWLALTSDEPVEGGDDAVRRLVGAPAVASVVARHIRYVDLDVADAAAERLDSVCDDAVAGAAWLRAVVAVRHGDTATARRLLAGAAAVQVPGPADGWSQAWGLLGELDATAGDIDSAQRLWRTIGSEERAQMLGRWRPMAPVGVGRNEPCPCGSGRKFKQCCLRHPAPLDLDTRTPLVWWKIHTWALGHHRGCVPDLDFMLATAAVDVLLFSIQVHMAEGGAIAEILDELTGVLPDDEADLARSWVDVRHRLWRVESAAGVGTVRLHDVGDESDGEASGADVTVAPDHRAGMLEPGDHVIGLVVAGPSSIHLAGHPLPVRPDAVAAARAGLIAGPDPDALYELARQVVDPER